MDLLNILGVISRMNKTQLHMMPLQFVCLFLLHCLKLYFFFTVSSQQTANSQNIFGLNFT